MPLADIVTQTYGQIGYAIIILFGFIGGAFDINP
jgi:hypothetical protein